MKKNGFVGILIILVITILAVVGYFAYKNFVSDQKNDSSIRDETAYKLTLKVVNKNEKPKSSTGSFTTYLENRLDLNEKNPGIFYDGSKFPSQFGWDWLSDDWKEIEIFLLTKSGTNPKLIQKSDGYIKIEIEKADDSLIPYLIDAKYCQSNADCIIRDYICDTGSFNRYTKYFDAFGCEGEGPSHGEYNPNGQCYYTVIYTNPRCLNNQCVGDKNLSKECVPYEGP